jgi:hypothetical protein
VRSGRLGVTGTRDRRGEQENKDENQKSRRPHERAERYFEFPRLQWDGAIVILHS